MCFCSLGAIKDRRYQRYEELLVEDQDKNRLSRPSFDDTENGAEAGAGAGIGTEVDDVAKQIPTIVRKRSSKIFDRISFGGGQVEHEYTGMYGNDGKTVTKHSAPAPTPEERRSSLILSQSWGTILNTDAKEFTLPSPAAAGDIDTTSGSLSREKSRKLSKKEILTPRGDTIRAVTNSSQRNAARSQSIPTSRSDVEEKEKKENEKMDENNNEEIELSAIRRGTTDFAVNGSNDVGNQIIQIQAKVFQYPEDRLSDNDANMGVRSRRGSSGSPSPFMDPSTPRFNQSYYQRMNLNQPGQIQQIRRVGNNPDIGSGIIAQSHSLSRTNRTMEASVQSSGTEAPSQTFLLLSDDDFVSGRDDEDIYQGVPEESAAETSSAVQ